MAPDFIEILVMLMAVTLATCSRKFARSWPVCMLADGAIKISAGRADDDTFSE